VINETPLAWQNDAVLVSWTGTWLSYAPRSHFGAERSNQTGDEVDLINLENRPIRCRALESD
jgi:hypothetical protein